jgi:REP element-mobilizing transposase RayT
MSTFTKLSYHLVFATKHRAPIISTAFQSRLYEYIGGIICAKNGHILEIGGVADHLHIAANLSPKIAVSDVIRDIKGGSSSWINTEKVAPAHFDWQRGYAAFTVSQSNLESVLLYIRNQEEHHRTKSFEEEFIEFLERHQIAYKREYLFEDEHHG